METFKKIKIEFDLELTKEDFDRFKSIKDNPLVLEDIAQSIGAYSIYSKIKNFKSTEIEENNN